MASVTSRSNKVKQPYGGYLPASTFRTIGFTDNFILNPEENISPQNLGLAVDYLTRFLCNQNGYEAFDISVKGARAASIFQKNDDIFIEALDLVEKIEELDDESIISACKLVEYDVWIRNPMGAIKALLKGYKPITPNTATIQNIRILVTRCLNMIEEFGEIVKCGFTFRPENASEDESKNWNENHNFTFGGYTATVNSGDGDFLTKDTLFDIKVSKRKLSKENTLQILMYWIMGKHSGQNIFEEISKLGFINPRFNEAYILNIADVSEDIITKVEKEVICY